MSGTTYTLLELAAKSGVSARTIRFYISKGLLAPSLTRGRNACYGEEHLTRLQQILRERGERPLAELREQPEGLVAPAPWRLYQVAPDAVVMLRADTPPWRAHHLEQATQAFAARVAVVDDEEKH